MNNISMCLYRLLFFSPIALDIGTDIQDTISGAFEDFGDYITGLIHEKIADCIVAIIKLIVDLLTGGLSTGNGVFSAAKNLMLYHPKNYMQGTIWNNVKSISELVVVPIATTFIAVIAVYDLYQMVVVGNGMHDFDSSFIIRWLIKTYIAITLVANAFPITSWLFSFGSDIAFYTVGGNGNWLTSMLTDISTADTLKESLLKYGSGELLITLFLAVITLGAVFFMFVTIVIGLMGRMIEMFMYMSVAPIPISTLMNNETKGIGDSWIRGALGLSFQVFFIIIALSIFGSIFQNTMNSLVNGTDMVWNMVLLCAYSISLIVTIMRTGQISKGMFGAH